MNISLRLNDLNKLKGLFLLFLLVKNFQLCSQVCSKPGLLDPNNSVSGVVNTYYPPSSSSQTVIAGSTSISLGSVPSGFGSDAIAIGDLLLIIQMQDATINTSNTSQYGSGSTTAGLDGLGGTGASSIGNSGKYEYIVATSNVSTAGGVLTFTAYSGLGLINTYRQALTQGVNGVLGRKTFQVIRVPQYSSIMLTGNITSPAFNGTVGGIVVMDIAGLLNFNGFSIDVSEKGFRGGFSIGTKRDTQTPFPSYANSYTVNGTSISPSGKGEGIAGTPKDVFDGMNRVIISGVDGYPGGDLGRGAPANAGGGGDDHNAGGGGGANGGFGGIGGWGIYNVGSVTQPTSNPNYYTYDSRGRFGSKYFSSVNAPIGLLCLGGGGGAGQRDNMTTSDGNPAYDNIVGGGPGGGIVIVRAGKVTGNGSIISNGKLGVAGNKFLSAACSCNSCNGGGIDLTNVDGVFIPQSSTGEWCLSDGASGGGAGGSVFFYVENNSTGANISINTRGGNGGNTNTWLNEVSSIGHGPGGGGGGGVIQYYCPGATITNNANGGIAGVNLFNSNSKGATAGASGSVVNFNPLTDFLTVPQIISNSSLCFPNLQATKIEANPGAPGSRSAGSIATYTLSLTNTGGSTANLVSLIDNLSSYFTFNAGSATVSYLGGATGPAAGLITPSSLSPLTFNSFTIPVGGIVNVVFSITTNISTPSGIYHNGTYSSYLDPTRTIIGSLITPSLNATAGNLIYQGTGATVLGSNYNGTSSGPVNEDVYICATPTINVTSSSSFSICNGSSVILTAVGASSYTWSNGAITNTISVSPTSTTNYSIVGFDSGCSGTRNLTINVNPLPTITVVPSLAAICSGATATLTAGGASTYTWTAGPTSATYPVSTAGVFTVTGTDAFNCINTKTVSLTVNPLPTITAVPSTTAICSGATATLTAGGASTYTWTSGPTSATYPVNTAGVYTVTGTNSNGCVNTRTVSLTVNPLPTITAAPSSAAICSGSTATLTASGASTYTWTSGPVTATYPVNTAGVYTVTGTNSNGCVNTRTVSLTVNPIPSLTTTAGGLLNVSCLGSATGSLSTTASGTSGYSYVWSPSVSTSNVATGLNAGVYTTTVTDLNGCKAVLSNTISAPSASLATAVATRTAGCGIANGSATVTPSGGWSSSYTYTWSSGSSTSNTATGLLAGAYTATVTDANGCKAIQVVNIVNPTTPTLAVSASSSAICSGNSSVITPSLSTSVLSYSINGVASAGPSFTVNPSATSIYNINATDVSNCVSNLASLTITVNATPTLAIALSSTSICVGASATLTPSGASTYTLVNTGAAITTNTVVNPTATTVYTVSGTSAAGCLGAQQTINLAVNALPNLTLSTSSNTICAGNNATLTANGADTYSWTSGPSDANYIVNPTTTTVYEVIGTNTVTTCNSAISQITITVNSVPTVTANASPSTVCSNGYINLTAIGATTYTWSGTGITSSNENSVNPIFAAPTASTYSYNLVGSNSDGCLSSISTVTVDVVGAPSSSLAIANQIICIGTTGVFEIANPQSGVAYTWNSVSTGTNYSVGSPITNTAGNYTINVVAMLGAGSNTCATTSNGTLTINELPTVTIDQTNLTLCDGEQATISIVNPLPAPATYAWSYNNSTGNSLTLSNLEAGSSGNYTVTVNDGNGCSNQTTFELVVNACGVFIPELFSPNGDYQNDVFVIKNIENYPNNHVLIYNRWGNLVYEKNGYNNDWKGTNDKADGKILPAGTYFIILDFGDNGKTPIYKGYIMLEY